METQVCNRCLKAKPILDFNWRYKALGIRQRTCRFCQAEQKKAWYEKHGDKHRERVRQNNRQIKEEGRQFVYDYLSTHPCVDCGESDPRVLEFDHIKGRKYKAISRMVSNNYPVSAIQQEISKTVIRCANCHRRKTYEEKGWGKR